MPPSKEQIENERKEKREVMWCAFAAAAIASLANYSDAPSDSATAARAGVYADELVKEFESRFNKG